MTDHRALHIKRMIDSPAWRFAKDILSQVVRSEIDAALTNNDPARDLGLLHSAQCARRIATKFENALASAASVEGEQENNA